MKSSTHLQCVQNKQITFQSPTKSTPWIYFLTQEMLLCPDKMPHSQQNLGWKIPCPRHPLTSTPTISLSDLCNLPSPAALLITCWHSWLWQALRKESLGSRFSRPRYLHHRCVIAFLNNWVGLFIHESRSCVDTCIVTKYWNILGQILKSSYRAGLNHITISK